jgi:hypothetical protein
VHVAERAVDVSTPQGLEQLAVADPAHLFLQLAPGSALIVSAHPVASIWHAHQVQGEDRFAPVRAAFAARAGESAWVVREGFRVAVYALQRAEQAFVAALFAGQSLGAALQAAGEDFLFEAWLIRALQQRHLAAVWSTPWAVHSTSA